jgi:hypothetical protein
VTASRWTKRRELLEPAPARLSLVFLALFGLASVWSLSHSNEVSKDVRDRWLSNTRLLGDLNNFTSDYGTAEADSLIVSSPDELRQALHDIQVLDQAVVRAQRGYESIPHDACEWELYHEFSVTWDAYRLKLADRVTTLVSSSHPTDAIDRR